MKSRNVFFNLRHGMLLCVLLTLLSCATPQIGQPPPQAIYIRTFYKSGNSDLLDSTIPNSFKKNDLKVTSKIKVGDETREVSYDEDGIEVTWDNDFRMNCFGIYVPTNYGKTPIATYVQLSPTDMDTVTYTFNGTQHPYIPDQIFYNQKMVWDVVNAPDNGRWPPITVVK